MWMLVAVLAPELILGFAVENYLDARYYLPYMTSFGADGWTMTHMLFAANEGFHNPLTNERVHNPLDLAELARLGQVREPPISAEELYSRGKSDVFIKVIALLQILWFALQTLFRAASPAHTTTALEISTGAFVFCSLMTYAFYWKLPQDVEYAITLKLEGEDSVAKQDSGGATKVRDVRMQFTLLAVFCAFFGAIHCLAWNLPFTTPQEKLAWHVCAVSTTVLGPLMVMLMIWFVDDSSLEVRILRHGFKHFKRYEWFYTLSFTFCYAVVRITNLILAFTALRALPDNVYQTVKWSGYLPHLGT